MASSELPQTVPTSVGPIPASITESASDSGSGSTESAVPAFILDLELDLCEDGPPPLAAADESAAAPTPALPPSPVLPMAVPRPALPPPTLDLADQSIILLDPSLVRLSKDYNREDTSFDGADFRELVRSVIAHGGNLQPVCVVEQVDDQGMTYQIVFGERRVRACREAQVKVRAMVMQSRSPLDSSLLRLGENRGRRELAPLEFGRQVKRVLDDPTCCLTKTQLAKMLGCHPGHVGRAYELASLSPSILEAFANPMELQYAHMLPLKRAYDTQGLAVLDEAWAIREEFEPVATEAVVERLLKAAQNAEEKAKAKDGGGGGDVEAAPAKKPPAATQPKRIKVKGRDIGQWEVMPSGSISLQIDEPMSALQRQELLAMVAAQVEEQIMKPKKAEDSAGATSGDGKPEAAEGEVA